MRKNIAYQVYLMAGSVLSVLGFYLTYIWLRQQSFKPAVDYSLYIPSYWRYLKPEIEVQLYGLGVFAIALLSPLLFFLLKRFLREEFSGIFMRAVIVLDLSVVFGEVFFGKLLKAEQVFVLFLFLYIFVLFSLFFLSKRLIGLFLFLKETFDWTLAFSISIAAILVARSLLFFPVLSSPDTIELFKDNSYEFFRGLPRKEFLAVVFIVVFIFLAWIRNFKSFLFPKLNLIILPIIIILLSISSSLRSHDLVFKSHYEYNYMIGPVNDILHGKTLLVNSYSQYGLLSIYFFSLLFKFLLPLSYNNFFWLYFAVTVVGYFLIYLIMRRLIGGVFLPILGLFLTILLNYYLQVRSLFEYPQVGFLRFGWWIIIAYCIALLSKLNIRGVVKFIIEVLLVSIAAFWTADAGLYVLGAYLSTVVFREVMKRENLKHTTREIGLKFFSVFASLLLFFVIISFITQLRTNAWPNWHMFVGDAGLFASGYGLLPIKLFGPHLIFIVLYLWAIIYILNLMFGIEKKVLAIDNLSVLVFIASYGILQFVYYVGRSDPNNLHHVVIPLIILFCWLLKRIKVFFLEHKILSFKSSHKVSVLSGSILCLMIFSVIIGAGVKHVMVLYLFREDLQPRMDELKEDVNHKNSINGIKEVLRELTGNKRRIAIISEDDAFFLVASDSVNIMDSNNLRYFILTSDFNKLSGQLIKNNPQYIFVDHKTTIEHVDILKKIIEPSYDLQKNIGVLDVWQKRE